MKSGPHLPQLEKALAQKWRPNITINQSRNKSLKKKKLKSGHVTPLFKVLPWFELLRIKSKTWPTDLVLTSLDLSPIIFLPSLSGLQPDWLFFFSSWPPWSFFTCWSMCLETHHHFLHLTDAYSSSWSQLKHHFSGKSSIINSRSVQILHYVLSISLEQTDEIMFMNLQRSEPDPKKWWPFPGM